jgi:hypothetical protein
MNTHDLVSAVMTWSVSPGGSAENTEVTLRGSFTCRCGRTVDWLSQSAVLSREQVEDLMMASMSAAYLALSLETVAEHSQESSTAFAGNST